MACSDIQRRPGASLTRNAAIERRDPRTGTSAATLRRRAALRQPIPRQAVIEHSANTHVIPLDSGVRRQLKRLRVGQVVQLTGFLVNAVRDDGTHINASLTRSDSGPGSCEVVLVGQSKW